MLNQHYVCEGNIGKDPEQKTIKNGDMTISSLAVFKTREKTLWFTLKAFGSSAKQLFEAKKGDRAIVSGQIDIDEWEDKTGSKRTTVCILVDSCRIQPKKDRTDAPQQASVGSTPSDDLPF